MKRRRVLTMITLFLLDSIAAIVLIFAGAFFCDGPEKKAESDDDEQLKQRAEDLTESLEP